MSEFQDAVEFVLQNEGEFVNDPADSGGATNFGISLRFLREISAENLRKYGIFRMGDALNVEDIEKLTRDQAKLIYKGEFWDHAPFEKLSYQDICNYLFDCCVLHGTSQGIKLAQRAMWAYFMKRSALIDDGIMGDKTLYLMKLVPTPSYFVSCLMAERAGFMRLLAVKNPKDERFLNGWLNRCYRI